jgi:hypothetical protein
MNQPFTYDRLVTLLTTLAGYALMLGGLVAIAAVVFYGLMMVVSRGDAAKFTTAKNNLIKAAIGALLIFGVYTVINTIEGAAHTLIQ